MINDKKINFDYVNIFALKFNEIIIEKLKVIRNKIFKIILHFSVVKIINKIKFIYHSFSLIL